MGKGGRQPADRVQVRLDDGKGLRHRQGLPEPDANQFETVFGGDTRRVLEHRGNVAVTAG